MMTDAQAALLAATRQIPYTDKAVFPVPSADGVVLVSFEVATKHLADSYLRWLDDHPTIEIELKSNTDG